MGAVYQAAALSKAFKVKPFFIRDAAVFPIQVSVSHSQRHAAGETNLDNITSQSRKKGIF